MKYVRFGKDSRIYYGILEDETIFRIEGNPFDEPPPQHPFCLRKEATLLAPVEPSKIIAVGLNYRDHAEELKMSLPPEPLIFLKPPSSVIGPGDTIYFPSQSQRLDYEAEMGIVIKRTARHISCEDADSVILGYTCVNDITARDLQKKDIQWTRAKSFDSFCPIGPLVETSADASHLKIELLVNGQIKQKSSTENMIFGYRKLVSFISDVMTLNPGDVIATGTPAGVGPLSVGDTVEVRIENIGSLVNTVKLP